MPMRKFIVLLLLAALASGTFDQTYVQTLADNGSSVIVKTQDLSVFSGSVSFPALSRACADLTNVQCLVSGQTMMISDSFAPDGSYYTYASDGGFPFITRTLLISRVPNDVFGADLSKVLDAANFTSTGVLDVESGTELARVRSGAYREYYERNYGKRTVQG